MPISTNISIAVPRQYFAIVERRASHRCTGSSRVADYTEPMAQQTETTTGPRAT